MVLTLKDGVKSLASVVVLFMSLWFGNRQFGSKGCLDLFLFCRECGTWILLWWTDGSPFIRQFVMLWTLSPLFFFFAIQFLYASSSDYICVSVCLEFCLKLILFLYFVPLLCCNFMYHPLEFDLCLYWVRFLPRVLYILFYFCKFFISLKKENMTNILWQ